MNPENCWYCVVEISDPNGQPYWQPTVTQGASAEVGARRAMEAFQPLQEGWRMGRITVAPYASISEWLSQPTQRFSLGTQIRRKGEFVS